MKFRKTKRALLSDYSLPSKIMNLEDNSNFLKNTSNYSEDQNDTDPCTSNISITSKDNKIFNNESHLKKNSSTNSHEYFSDLINIEKQIFPSVIKYNNNKLNNYSELKQDNNIKNDEFTYKDPHRPIHISPPSSPKFFSNNLSCDINEMLFSPKHKDFSRTTPFRKNLIQKLIEIDELESFMNLKGLQLRTVEQESLKNEPNAHQRLSHIGDEIVEQLVEWTKMLPFYNELPVEVHTHLLTQRWAELVLLSTCYYASCNKSELLIEEQALINEVFNAIPQPNTVPSIGVFNLLNTLHQQCLPKYKKEFERTSSNNSNINLRLLQRRLSAVMNKHVPFEHVNREASLLVEKFTKLYNSFSKLNITLEAYVCLKVITILNYTLPVHETEAENKKSQKIYSLYSRKVTSIQDQFIKALQIHLSQIENGPRLTEILNWQPLLNECSIALLQSKMFYVPFLISKEPNQLILTKSNSINSNYNNNIDNQINEETDCDE